MSYKKLPVMQMFTLVFALVAGSNGIARADMVAGVSLNAQAVVDAFNGLNDGKGIHFDIDFSDLPIHSMISMQGSQFADTSAYNASRTGENSFTTVWLQHYGIYANQDNYGTLNYNPLTGTTQVLHPDTSRSLSLGGAYLYTMYATQDSAFTAGDSTVAINQLLAAIRFLADKTDNYTVSHWQYLGNLRYDQNDWDGSGNPYLQMLLDINGNIDYWKSVYNPDAYYTEIGNYSVFVINNADPRHCDFLYLAAATNPHEAATPEPATILLWTLGTLGVAGTSCARKRSGVKNSTASFLANRKKKTNI